MLKQRVLTALVLLAVLLPALLHDDPVWLRLVVLVMVTAGAWEWGRMNGLRSAGAVALAVVMLLAGLLTGGSIGWLMQPHPWLWLCAGSLWVLGSAALVRAGVPGWARVPRLVRVPVGLLTLWVAGVAVVQARDLGVNFLLSALALVWAADIFAYFAGRALGQRFVRVKLAAAISPGKSWEGAVGGALGVVLVASLWVVADAHWAAQMPSLYTLLHRHGGAGMLVVAVLFLTAMSVIGDLVESLIKRSAGVKDSSQLLPGHGGVLDRIDALLPTLPLAMMLASWLA